MGDVHTSAGSRIYIGTTVAAANQAQFEADVYKEIGEVVTIGEFGRQYEPITHTSIGNRAVRKFKGAFDDGDLPLGLGKDPDDVGQAALRAALSDDRDYNFKVVENDESEDTDAEGTTHYFRAKVMSYRTNINDPNSIVQATATIGIQSGTHIEIAAS